MNAGNLIAIMGIAVTMLIFVVTAQWRSSDKRDRELADERAKNAKLEAENTLLRDINIDLKIANASFSGMAATLDRTLSALPIQRKEGSAP